jgi:gluconokinase
VVACSALKRSYRDFICSHAGEVTFVLPDIDHNLLRARLSGRAEHFMPSLLLESQLATLERPQPDERAILISADNLAEQVKQVIARL